MPPHVETDAGLAEAVLRAALAFAAIVAATSCVSALLLGAGPRVAVEGLLLLAIAGIGVARVDVAARLLRPNGRCVVVAGLFGLAGILDPGLYEHYTGIAGIPMAIAAFVSSARWVAICVAVSTAAYLCALALDGSTLAWMVGDGGEVIVGQLVNFAGTAAACLLVVGVLRRVLASSPQRLAAVRAGGPSLTPQLALAARGGAGVALLPPAEPRILIAGLTHGERDVLALLASGRVPKQAAGDLVIALATVRSRISSAKHKTGARTLDQLVAMYAEAELAPRPAELRLVA